MTARELIEALQKASNLDKNVTILDKPAKFEAEIAVVDEDDPSDPDGEIHIVIEEWPTL